MNILMMASSKRIGLTYHLTQLSLALKQSGHNVIVVASSGEQQRGLKKLLENADIPLFILPTIDTISLKMLKFNALQLSRIIDKKDIDVIHANGLAHLFYAYFGRRMSSRKPALVMTVHSYFHGEPYARIYLIIECVLLNLFTDLVLPVSSMTSNELTKSGLPSRKIMVVYNGLNLKTFDESLMKKVSSSRIQTIINEISGKPIVISMGSQLVPRKGHVYLLKAIKYVKDEYSNIRCVITGTGPLLGKLKKMAYSLGIADNVIFTGYLRYEDMLQILKLANVAIITSLSETFCHAIIEPLAAKKPIITTPVGVAPEVIKYNVGLIVPKKDSKALANAIVYLFDNPEKANEMGLKGRKVCEMMFSIEKIVNMLEKAYILALANSCAE